VLAGPMLHRVAFFQPHRAASFGKAHARHSVPRRRRLLRLLIGWWLVVALLVVVRAANAGEFPAVGSVVESPVVEGPVVEGPVVECIDAEAGAASVDAGGCMAIEGADVDAATSEGAAEAAAVLAAGSGEQLEAPMCDRMGMSIGAVDEIPERDRGRLDVLPCEAWRFWGERGPGESGVRGGSAVRYDGPQAPLEVFDGRAHPDGVRAVPLVLPARGAGLRIPSPYAVGLRVSAGHRASVYRPPRHLYR
jgi:hypothetical protein